MSALAQVQQLAASLSEKVVAQRRDFHRHAELGWMEYRTASLVARRLDTLGYDVRVGSDVVDAASRMGVPAPEVLAAAWQRALEQGGDPEYLAAVEGGFTGVVGVLRCGEGPTVALRFDMDALGVREGDSDAHRPAREGFASINEGAMHACGHDGHAAIGLGVAEVLAALRDELGGTVKLIFQPAEEGVRGARAMVEAGVVDDVDCVLGLHLYSGWPLGQVAGGRSGFLATHKFDAILTGESAHAGASPQAGRNALLAASNAVVNLYAIPRHREGVTRINVGQLVAGTGRNVICGEARLVIETRGATDALAEYMYRRAARVLESSAAMYGCSLDIVPMGAAEDAASDPALAARVERVAQGMAGFSIRPSTPGGGSEDFTYMMRRVQANGGQATFIGLGADLGGWGHHTATFDFDERALSLGVALLAAVARDVLSK